MKPRTSKPPPRPSKLPSTRNPTPKWSPSANQDMVVMDMVDMEDMDTNTVTKLPKKPNTMYHPYQLLNQSPSQEYHAKTSLKTSASKSQKLKIHLSPLTNVPMLLENQPAKRSN